LTTLNRAHALKLLPSFASAVWATLPHTSGGSIGLAALPIVVAGPD